jgi:hypothetical protein
VGDPFVVTTWPGPTDDVYANKVPKTVPYQEQRDKTLGFGCALSRLITPDIRVEDNSLSYLDPEYQEEYPDEPLIQQSKEFYADFLADVIRHIIRRFPNSCKRKALQFIFSTPPYREVPDRGIH